MDIIYLKIRVPKTAEMCDEIREQGLFFENIADSLSLDRNHISEIDEYNFKNEIQNLKKRFGKSKSTK